MVPRGHRWELGGRTFLALGGAPSINRHRLTEGVDWWPSEVLLDEHVDAAVAAGPADVMLTHDSPGSPWCTPQVEAILRRNVRENPWAWPPEALAYAAEGLELTTRAVLGVRPRFLAHGHFHVAGEDRVRLPGADARHRGLVSGLAPRPRRRPGPRPGHAHRGVTVEERAAAQTTDSGSSVFPVGPTWISVSISGHTPQS